MDLFGRYIFRQTLSTMVLIMVSLTTVVWLASALQQLSVIAENNQSFTRFFSLTALALPSVIAMILPIALLLATLHILNRLNTDSELIVMSASGATVWRFATPLLLLATLVSIILLALNVVITPQALRTLRLELEAIRTDLIGNVLQEGEFASAEQGLTFHIRERAANGDLLGLMVHDARDQSQTLSYLAERARVLRRDGKPMIVMANGHVHRVTPDQPGAQILEFDQYVFDLSSLGDETGPTEFRPRERTLDELINPDPKGFWAQRSPGRLRGELHDRFATVIYPLVFVMLALAAGGHARTTRQRSIIGLVVAFALATLSRLTGITATNLAVKDATLVPLVYAVPIATFILAAIAAHVRMRPSVGVRLRRRRRPPAVAALGQAG